MARASLAGVSGRAVWRWGDGDVQRAGDRGAGQHQRQCHVQQFDRPGRDYADGQRVVQWSGAGERAESERRERHFRGHQCRNGNQLDVDGRVYDGGGADGGAAWGEPVDRWDQREVSESAAAQQPRHGGVDQHRWSLRLLWRGGQHSGTWDTRGDALFLYYGGTAPAPVFNNSGSFTKTGGTGSTVFSGTAFNNSGMVSVQKGTLELGAGGTGIGSLQCRARTPSLISAVGT